MALKFRIFLSRNDQSVLARFCPNSKKDEAVSAGFDALDEVECTGVTANTIESLLTMPGSQGELFRQILEELVAQSYRQGLNAAEDKEPNLCWPPGHD
ncbi:MAG: hypothetical protein ACOYUZ_05055 [Patescibacteria group bacterium]